MNTVSQLISRRYLPEVKVRNKSSIETLSAPLRANIEKPAYNYEAEVFNFLLDNKKSLGIKTVMKFTGLLVDGAIELLDGKRLTLEIKFRMNWTKACQAEWQFRTFLKRHKAKVGPVDGGVVLFEDFAGDGWDRRPACRLLVNGWNCWYGGHSEVDGLRLDLLRLHMGKLESYSLADVIKGEYRHANGEDANRRIAGLATQEG